MTLDEFLQRLSQQLLHTLLQNIFLCIFQELFQNILLWLPAEGSPLIFFFNFFSCSLKHGFYFWFCWISFTKFSKLLGSNLFRTCMRILLRTHPTYITRSCSKSSCRNTSWDTSELHQYLCLSFIQGFLQTFLFQRFLKLFQGFLQESFPKFLKQFSLGTVLKTPTEASDYFFFGLKKYFK